MIDVKSMVKDFFKVKFNIYLIIILLIIGGIIYFGGVGEETPVDYEGHFAVHYFYLPTCPHCKEMRPVVEELEQEMPEIPFIYVDASTPDGSKLLYEMAEKVGLDTSSLGVPLIFAETQALMGVHSKEDIKSMILECKLICEEGREPVVQESNQQVETAFSEFDLPFLGRTDLTQYSLPGLAVVLGLIDGFNPCAMWVLVFLIGILLEVKDRKRVWLIVGSFVLASGILYFLFMTAWLNVFLLAGYIRTLTVLIGLFALGGGIISVKEYIESRNQPLTCKIGDLDSRAKTMDKVKHIATAPLTITIFFSIIALAFVVNSVEFVCSSAIPAVFTQVLALSGLGALKYYSYIFLYTFFFMLDDLVIFGMAALAINSSFGEKYAKYCHLAGGVIMVVLGFLLLFMPELLR
jgi:thiol-disulfide isomerase/thioredoxin